MSINNGNTNTILKGVWKTLGAGFDIQQGKALMQSLNAQKCTIADGIREVSSELEELKSLYEEVLHLMNEVSDEQDLLRMKREEEQCLKQQL